MRYGLLGPLEVVGDGGERLSLGGLRQRAVLAILLLHANQVVPSERLVEELWGEHVPPRATHTVQVFVSRLRKALGRYGDRLETRAPGYLIAVGGEELARRAVSACICRVAKDWMTEILKGPALP